MAKERVLTISELCFDSIFAAVLRTGYESNTHPYRITAGLPKDARLVAVRLLEPGTVYMRFWSEEFEDVEDPDGLPSMTIMAEMAVTQ